MNYRMKDCYSTYWIARDMYGGYRLTSEKAVAEVFHHIPDVSAIVKEVLAAFKRQNRKVLISVIRV